MSRIAVIGGGVSGLTAAYILATEHDVTVFEADSRLGGHSHTHTISDPAGTQRIDTGFIVHNDRTYPHLLRLFDELSVATQDTEMSMSIVCDGCGIQYAGGRGGKGLVADPKTVFNPKYLKLLTEVKRFHTLATKVLSDANNQQTWGEFLRGNRFSEFFVNHYAVPVVACVWSAAHEVALQYPARYLFQFLSNHGMLSVGNSPTWRTVIGGSNTYVDALRSKLEVRGSRVLLNTPVVRATQPIGGRPGSVTLGDGGVHNFDKMVIATHADTAAKILDGGSVAEREALAAIEYSHNETMLHTDASVLPTARQARSSWNYRLHSCTERSEAVQVSYWMNKLQKLPAKREYLVTLNADRASIAPGSELATMHYTHPIFTRESVQAAETLRNAATSDFAWAGAHLGWGFHEDGCRSGVAAAQALGVKW